MSFALLAWRCVPPEAPRSRTAAHKRSAELRPLAAPLVHPLETVNFEYATRAAEGSLPEWFSQCHCGLLNVCEVAGRHPSMLSGTLLGPPAHTLLARPGESRMSQTFLDERYGSRLFVAALRATTSDGTRTEKLSQVRSWVSLLVLQHAQRRIAFASSV